MSSTKAHCNQCGGDRNHEVLHTEKTSWEDEEYGEYGVSKDDTYEMLKCLGCDNVKLRHTSWSSEGYDVTVNYFPPAIFRARPDWLSNLWRESDDDFVQTLLNEIYVALQNNLPNLSAMGIRSLIEKIMIAKIGDQGSFNKNIAEFEKHGYVSRIQRDRLEAILEAGHAVIHRTFTPTTEDVITLVDITEHIIETVYLHESKITELKKRVPPRTVKS